MVLGGGLTRVIDMRAINWMGLAFATPAVFWAGWPFFVRGWNSVVNRSPNMFTLIAMGVGSAYAYSTAATLAPRDGVSAGAPARWRAGVRRLHDRGMAWVLRRGGGGTGPAGYERFRAAG
jgi:cation transport ATPase